MRITELRVLHERFDPDAVSDNTRGATTADLVAALQEEGVGEVEKRHVRHVPSRRHYDICSKDCEFVDVLVVRIEGETR